MLDQFDAEAQVILAEQIRLCEISAPTGAEGARAAVVTAALSAAGYRARRDEVGNVIAQHPLAASVPERPIVLSAHLDTVFGPDQPVNVVGPGEVNPYRRDEIVPPGEYHAPGISDAAAGLAAMLAVARELSATPEAACVLFVATVGEEGRGDLRGARHFFSSALGKSASAFITIDHSDASAIVNRGIGSRRYRAEYRSRGGHSWAHFGRYSPTFALATACDQLAEWHAPRSPRTTFNVGVVAGGAAVNAIPESATMEVDLRSESPAQLDELDQAFQDALRCGHLREQQRRGDGALEPIVERIGDRPAGITPPDADLVQAAQRALEAEQLRPRLIAASTDANAAIAAGVPAIAMSWGGRSDNQHSVREWFDPTGRSRSLRVLTRILLDLCQPDQETGAR